MAESVTDTALNPVSVTAKPERAGLPAADNGMPASDRSDMVRTLDDLRTYIHSALCAKENLLAEQFKMRESRLVRSGEFCGYQFSVDGPRSVRLGAIWTTEHNAVYFYNTRGERYMRVDLPHRISGTNGAGAASPEAN